MKTPAPKVISLTVSFAMTAFVLAGCGSAAVPAPSATTDNLVGPPPAPTQQPTVSSTPVPSATPVPTDTAAPTPTFVPPTPTPLPPTPTPSPTPKPPTPTATPRPAYAATPWEHLLSLRSYHLDMAVKADAYAYSMVADYSGSDYNLRLAQPGAPVVQVIHKGTEYAYGIPGGFFITGSAPPPQLAPLNAAQNFAQGWFDHPDSAVFAKRETINGVEANHFTVTWRSGRHVALGALNGPTYGPTLGDVWIDTATGALVKADFTMRVGTASAYTNVTTLLNVSNINRPIGIALPAA